MGKGTPMFLYHGKDDEVIPLHSAVLTYDYLRNIVYRGSHKLEFYVEDNLDHDEDSDKEWWEVSMFLKGLTWNNRAKEEKKAEEILPAEEAPAADPAAKEEAPAAEAPAAGGAAAPAEAPAAEAPAAEAPAAAAPAAEPAAAPAPAKEAAPAAAAPAAETAPAAAAKIQRHMEAVRRMFEDRQGPHFIGQRGQRSLHQRPSGHHHHHHHQRQ